MSPQAVLEHDERARALPQGTHIRKRTRALVGYAKHVCMSSTWVKDSQDAGTGKQKQHCVLHCADWREALIRPLPGPFVTAKLCGHVFSYE